MKKCLENECVECCNGMWLKTAKQTLERNNNITEKVCQSVRDLLDKGRGKSRNILIITLYNVCSVHGGMFSTSGGVQYIGGCSVHRGDIMSTVGGVS